MKSVHIQKDKSIFKIDELPAEAFAESMGLPGAPQIKLGNQKAAKVRGPSKEELARKAEKEEEEDEEEEEERAVVGSDEESEEDGSEGEGFEDEEEEANDEEESGEGSGSDEETEEEEGASKVSHLNTHFPYSIGKTNILISPKYLPCAPNTTACLNARISLSSHLITLPSSLTMLTTPLELAKPMMTMTSSPLPVEITTCPMTRRLISMLLSALRLLLLN